MEENLFTLWSIAHFASGIVLAFILSTKLLRIIEYAGILFFFPLLFVSNMAIKTVSFVIIFMAALAFVMEHLAKERKKIKKYYKLTIAIILLIGWEIFEYFTSPLTGFGIETITNRLTDIVIGFAGFILVYAFLNKKANKKLKKKFKNFSYHQ